MPELVLQILSSFLPRPQPAPRPWHSRSLPFPAFCLLAASSAHPLSWGGGGLSSVPLCDDFVPWPTFSTRLDRRLWQDPSFIPLLPTVLEFSVGCEQEPENNEANVSWGPAPWFVCLISFHARRAAASQGAAPSPFYRRGTQARWSCYLNCVYKGTKVGLEARAPGPRPMPLTMSLRRSEWVTEGRLGSWRRRWACAHVRWGERVTRERQRTEGGVLDAWMQGEANKCAMHGWVNDHHWMSPWRDISCWAMHTRAAHRTSGHQARPQCAVGAAHAARGLLAHGATNPASPK